MAEVTAMRNNATPYPLYGLPFALTFPLLDADGDPISPSSPDSEISKNGDTFADCTNEAVEIATSSGICYLLLTGTELTTDVATVRIQSTGAKTTVLNLMPRKLVSIRAGTSASAGSSTSTIVLDASASAADDFYNGMIVAAVIDSVTEVRMISDYTGSTQTATVVPDWNTAPDSDDTFTVYRPDGVQIQQANTTHLNSTTQTARDIGASVLLSSGTGTGQLKLVSGYVAMTWADIAAPTTTVALTGTTIATTQQVDVNTIKTQSVTCASGVTVSVNVGTTQPVNFTGTGATAYVQTDVINWNSSATPVTNFNTVYNTDFATVYDATNKAFLSKLGDFAMGGSSLALTTGAISATTFATSGTTTLNALTVNNATTLTGAVSLGSTLGVTGTTTLAAVTASGTVTFNALTVSNATTLTGAVSLGSTLGVTGATTLAGVTTSGTVTFNALTVTNGTTLTGAVSAANASNNIVGIDVAKISGDSTAADNAELFFDGTGYNASASTIGTATTLTNDPTGVTTLLTRLSAARAGYMDNLNVGGAVASQADITALNQSASRRLLLATVAQYERPESGSSTYTVELRTYDGDGAATNADSTPTLTATGIVSGSLAANLSAATNPATGVYRWTYTVLAAATVEQISFDVSATMSTAFTLTAYTQVVNLVSATWTSTDASNLTAIFNKLPSKSYLTGTANTDGDVQADEATGNFPGSVASVAGNVTGSIGSLAAQAKADVNAEADAALADAGVTTTRTGYLDNLSAGAVATASALATVATNVSTALSRLGSITGTGVNTVLGFFKSLLSKTASVPSDIGGTFDPAFDSTEAIRDRGDAAWITATGFSTHTATDVWNVGTRVLTAGTNIVLVKDTGVTGFNDVSTSDIDARLVAIGLDHLVAVAVVGADVVDNSIVAKLVSASATADWDTYVNTTDSLQALRDRGDAAWVTATGFAVAGDAMALTTSERGSVADKLLGRTVTGSADGGRTVAEYLQGLCNKIAFDVPTAGKATLYATDDTTALRIFDYTASAAAYPVTSLDPT